MLAILFFSLAASVLPQATPGDWKIVKDSKGVCQIAVPPDWDLYSESTGAAVLHDPTTAIAVVTSQPGQAFKPLPENLQKILGIRKDKLFENTAKRIFYQDKISRHPEDPNAYIVNVPFKNGTCSCRVVVLPAVSEEIAKKITLSVGPAQQ
ncbi:MAG TPA: hypothetical protein VFA33_15140 [Bryobacteraceae bacterium]|nr:hypothetical protein [Bryobacteraceae bacterium]